MNPVGIRELKARLSEYVDRAAAGEEILVTHRGKPVIKLVTVDEEEDVIARGIREGWIIPPQSSGGVRPYADVVGDPGHDGTSSVEWMIHERDEEDGRIDAALGAPQRGETA